MTQTILGPDNQQYNFPDEASPDQIKNYLRKQPSIQALMANRDKEASLPQYEDNTGVFSYLADIKDRGKALDESIEYFNQLQELEDDTPEYQEVLKKFSNAQERVSQYTETDQDNFFTTLGKAIATDVATVLGTGATTGAVGGAAFGPIGALVGGAVGAGTVGFERSRRQSQAFNAYRELIESGDLTNEELRGAARTAITQAGLEGGADALTGGLASGIGKGILKKVVLDSFVGAGSEVGAQALQRAYVSNLDVLGEGAVEEYLESALEGAVAQGALSLGLNAVNEINLTDSRLTPTEEVLENIEVARESGTLKDIVDEFALKETQEDAAAFIQQVSDPVELKKLVLKNKALELRKGKSVREQLDDPALQEIETEITSLIGKQGQSALQQDLFNNDRIRTEVGTETMSQPKFNIINTDTANRKKIVSSDNKDTDATFSTSDKTNTLTVEGIRGKTLSERADILRELIAYAKDNNMGIQSRNTKNADAWALLQKDDNQIGINYNKTKGKYQVKSIPKNLEQAQKPVTRPKAEIVPQDRLPLGEAAEPVQRKNKVAKDVEDTFRALFPNDFTMQQTLRGISDKNLAEVAKTPQFKQLKTKSNKINRLQRLQTAEPIAEKTTELVEKNVATEALDNQDYATKLAGNIRNFTRAPEALIDQAARGLELAEQVGDKPDAPTSQVISKGFLKYFAAAKDLASKYPKIADILNTVRAKLHTEDAVAKHMKGIIGPIKKSMKDRNTWDSAHEYLHLIDQFDGKKVDGQWVYRDSNGIDQAINRDLTQDIDILNNYYTFPMLVAKEAKIVQRQNALRAGLEPEAIQLIDNDIRKLESVTTKPYFPRRRFGGLRFKVGESLYAVEQVEGINKLNVLDKIKVNDDLYIHKQQWNDLKQRVKNEHGIDLKSPKEYFSPKVQGKLDDMTMFKLDDIDPTQASFDSFLENEAVMRLLDDADQNRLEYFRRFAAGDSTLDRILRSRRKVPGFSTDYDRIAYDAADGTARTVVNYLYEQPLRKIQKEYIQGHQPEFVKNYAEAMFGRKFDKASDDITRFQAFMALGFSPATAVLQTVSHVTTVPMQLSMATLNPVEISRALTNPISMKLFRNRLSGDTSVGTYKNLRKIAGKEFADFVTTNERAFTNNPKSEFLESRGDVDKTLSGKVRQVEDVAHGMMMRTEEATRLASGYSMFKMMQNPKYQQNVLDAMKNDARFQDSLAKAGDKPISHILTELMMDNSFGIYGKAGWAGFQRGWGRAIIPFASYPLQMTNMMLDHARGLKGRRAQLGVMITAMNMAVVFGMAGAPMYELFDLLYSEFNKFLGKPGKELDKDVFEAIYNVNPQAAMFFKRGFVGSLTGVDFGRRVSISSPFVGLYNSWNAEGPLGRDVGYILPKATDIREAVKGGDPLKIAQAASPIAVGNIIKGIIEYPTKGVTTKRGDVIIPEESVGVDDSIKRVLGFNPISVSNAQTAYYNAITEQNKYTGPKNRLIKSTYSDYKKWLESGQRDEASRQKVLEALKKYRELHERNGDPFTNSKFNGFMNSLKTAYQNEKGFIGGEPKSSLRSDILADSLEYYRQLEGRQ